MGVATPLRCGSPPELIVRMDLHGRWRPIAYTRTRTRYYRYTDHTTALACFIVCTHGLTHARVRGRRVVVTIEQDVGGLVVTIERLAAEPTRLKLSRVVAQYAGMR